MTKLGWLSGEYVRMMDSDRFYELSVHALAKADIQAAEIKPYTWSATRAA